MTPDEETILMIKGAISDLPPSERDACNKLAAHLRELIELAGPIVGPVAIALVGAELQAKS